MMLVAPVSRMRFQLADVNKGLVDVWLELFFLGDGMPPQAFRNKTGVTCSNNKSQVTHPIKT